MRSMSPMDSFEWFDTPTQTEVTCAGSGVTQLVTIDSRRVVLFIASNNTGAGDLVVGVSAAISGLGGAPLNSSTPPIIVSQWDTGPLPQTAWYCFNNNAAAKVVTVIEVRLRGWPEQEDEQVVAIEGLTDVVNRLSKLLREFERGRYPTPA